MTRDLRYALAGRVGRSALDLLLGTTRFRVISEIDHWRSAGSGSPVVFVLWHGRLLPLSYMHRHQGLATLISRSEDGEYISRIIEQWGYVVARGSSSRGGSTALRQMIRMVRSGRSLAITPDGPRGPFQRMKPGPILAAQLAGVPIVPVTAGTRRAWWIRSWDRMLVPRPFAEVSVAYGRSIAIPRQAGAGEVERLTRLVEEELNRLTRLVDGNVDVG
jgi:lysophospholipid acyltransferase (LPLAT)-like uncharacterized protein